MFQLKNNMNSILSRFIISILSLISIFIFPWWVLLIITMIISLFTPFFIEMIVIGYWLDILYGINDDRIMLIVFTISFLVVLYLKKNLIFK
jgi:hypothetical protein